MAEELKACPCCHQPASPAGLKHVGCMNADCMLSGMWWKWDIWQNKRAQVSQGGEAVEVVAYQKPSCENYYGYKGGYIDWKYSKDTMAVVAHLESLLDAIPDGPLYTHPADPGAAAVRRELLERVCQAADECRDNPMALFNAVEELRALLAKSEGEKP